MSRHIIKGVVSSGTSNSEDLVFVVRTTSINETFTFPLTIGQVYDFDVDLGDGSPIQTVVTDSFSHIYSVSGDYEVRITPRQFPQFRFNNTGDKDKIISIEQFGSAQYTDVSGQWYGCSNLTSINATDAPNLISCTSLMNYLRDTGITSLDISNYDTSTINDISNFVLNCSDLLSLNADNIDVSSVTTVTNMLFGCTNLTTATFASWNTINVVNWSNMYFNCSSLISIDISGFNPQNGTQFGNMFFGCTNLVSTGSLRNWNMSNAVNLAGFANECRALLELDVELWDTSNVTRVDDFTRQCISLTNLNPQDWNVGSCTNFANFMFGYAMSTDNYDQTLIKWAAQSPLSPNESPNFGNSIRTVSVSGTAYTTLTTAPNNWTISDGGSIP